MKDRQAELEKNIVAEGLAGFFKKVEPYSKLILVAVVVVVIALLGLAFYNNEQTAKRSDATMALLMESDEVAEDYPGTLAAGWWHLFQGEDNLAQGINALYQDRDEAETLLNEAKDDFINARSTADDVILVSRANFGLALAAESLGLVDEAIEAYQRTVDAGESDQMVEVAQERIDRLSNPSTTDFLAWFSEQDFSPADPSLPPELPGSSSLPDLPDLELPELDLGDDMKATDDPKAIDGGLQLPDATDSDTTDADAAEGDPTESDATESDATESDATGGDSASQPASSDAESTSDDNSSE